MTVFESVIGKNNAQMASKGEIEEFQTLSEVVEQTKKCAYSPILYKNDVRRGENFSCCQLVILDFDGAVDLEEINERVQKLGINYAIAPTQSHGIIKDEKETSDYFRLIIPLKTKITSKKKYKKVYNEFLAIFPEADSSCKDLARFYFSGKSESPDFVTQERKENLSFEMIQEFSQSRKDKINEGERNQKLYIYLVKRRKKDDSKDYILKIARNYNDSYNNPPLEDSEVENIVNNVFKYSKVKDERKFTLDVYYQFFKNNDSFKLVKDSNNSCYLYDLDNAVAYNLDFDDAYFKIMFECKNYSNQAIPEYLIKSLIKNLKADCRISGEIKNVYNRVAKHNGTYYFMLGNKRYMAINSDGFKEINEVSDLYFQVKSKNSELPSPKDMGFSNIRDFYNLKTDEDVYLMEAFIAYSMLSFGVYPVLVLLGEKGSAKSSAASLIKNTVDPSIVTLCELPQNAEDRAILAFHNHLLTFDNISGIKPDIADLLCKVSTGGNITRRSLYTNSDITVFNIKRPMILNGIDMFSKRSDLISRMVPLNFSPIPEDKKKRIEAIQDSYKQSLPGILFYFFDLISKTLHEFEGLKLTRSGRLVDFTQFGQAMLNAKGLKNSFHDILGRKTRLYNEQNFHENETINHILSLAAFNLEVKYPSREIENGLSVALSAKYISDSIRRDMNSGISPKFSNPSAVGKLLNRTSSQFEFTGLKLDMNRDSNIRHKVFTVIDAELFLSTVGKE